MKNFLCILSVFFFSAVAVQAQNEEYRFTGTVSVGATGTGFVVKAASSFLPDDSKVSVSVTPSFQGTVDYGIAKFFSVGGAVSVQNFALDVENYTYEFMEQTVTEDFKINANRATFALRPMFHYANNDRIDLYSGVRLQLIYWSVNADTTDPNFNFADNKIFSAGIRPGIGVVPFGMRAYVTENIGIGFELNIGAPYIANVGVSGRF